MEENLPKNNWFLPAIAFGFILLVSFLFIAGSPTTKPQTKTTSKQTTSSVEKGSVDLALSPEKLDLKVGVKTTAQININSTAEVSAVEIHLTFDPKVVTIKDVAPLEFFDNPRILKKEISNEKGEITFAIGGLPEKSGSGQLAQISLTAKGAGVTNLEFSQTSQAAVIGKNTNALGKKAGTIINVN